MSRRRPSTGLVAVAFILLGAPVALGVASIIASAVEPSEPALLYALIMGAPSVGAGYGISYLVASLIQRRLDKKLQTPDEE